MERIIESFEEFNNALNEKLIKSPKGGFTKKDIESLLKKHDDLSVYIELSKANFFVIPHMHNAGNLEKGDDSAFYPLNKAGKPVQIKFKDISSITV